MLQRWNRRAPQRSPRKPRQAPRLRPVGALPLVATSLVLCLGCGDEGIGDPCIPEDEYETTFAGFSAEGASVESRSLQCKSRLCLVNHFQGRVTCTYGQVGASGACTTPDGLPVEVPVAPQLQERHPSDAVYCSCRCDGPDSSAPYCECPEGFSCSELIPDIPLASEQRSGSYCVRDGTQVEPSELPERPCDPTTQSCGPSRAAPNERVRFANAHAR